jgi:hypothetical protein
MKPPELDPVQRASHRRFTLWMLLAIALLPAPADVRLIPPVRQCTDGEPSQDSAHSPSFTGGEGGFWPDFLRADRCSASRWRRRPASFREG